MRVCCRGQAPWKCTSYTHVFSNQIDLTGKMYVCNLVSSRICVEPECKLNLKSRPQPFQFTAQFNHCLCRKWLFHCMYICKKSADYALFAQAISRKQIELSTSNLVCTLLIRFRTDLMEEFFTAIGISKMRAADYRCIQGESRRP